MRVAKIKPQDGAMARELNSKMPPWARQVADNYNHLMEQPTIFYATALAAQLAGQTDAINIGLGWTYVSLRVLHSLIQGAANIVMVRFSIFMLASITLMILAVRVSAGVCGFAI